jgi:hypothetical protein
VRLNQLARRAHIFTHRRSAFAAQQQPPGAASQLRRVCQVATHREGAQEGLAVPAARSLLAALSPAFLLKTHARTLRHAPLRLPPWRPLRLRPLMPKKTRFATASPGRRRAARRCMASPSVPWRLAAAAWLPTQRVSPPALR